MTTRLGGLLMAWLVAPAILAQQPVRDTPAQPQTGTAAIMGTVTTDERSPQPARKTRVTLNSVDRGFVGRTVTTDDAGRFAFRNLPAGRFNVSATKPGYLTSSFGASRPERSPIAIPIAEGQTFVASLKLVRGGVITGTVRDQSGQPSPGLNVSVLRFGYSNLTGERTLQLPGGVSSPTDDRGVYRAWGLPPGDYLVVVVPATGGPAGRAGPPGLEDVRRISAADVQRALQSAGRSGAGTAPPPNHLALARINYATVFHPGTTDVANAATISLGPGEERAGIDVQMQLVPTARVTGMVNVPEAAPQQSVTLTLNRTGPQASLLAGTTGAVPTAGRDRDGKFAFAGITPGTYRLLAKYTPYTGRGQPTTVPVWWATADVPVDGTDIDLTLELQPPMTITGRVVFEGMAPPPDPSGMRIFLPPSGSGNSIRLDPSLGRGTVDAQGKFEFTGVTPGTFWPTYGSFAADKAGLWTVKKAVANGRDTLDAPLEIKPNEHLDWVLTFGDQATELGGTVSNASGRAATDYFVIVFPADKTLWTAHSRRVRTTRPATDGKYSVKWLPAGDYLIAALIDVEQGEWNDPSFLARLVSSSIKVALAEGKTTTQDLRLAGGR